MTHGRDAARTPAVPRNLGAVGEAIERNFRHYNAGRVRDAARGWVKLLDDGGAMLVTLAGAMSSAQLGISLAPLIRAGKIHAISCTGANLEEDIMNLIGRDQYEEIPDYRDLSPEDDEDIWEEGKNRVTDTAIPDTVMLPLAKAMMKEWRRLEKHGERAFPHEVLFRVLRSGVLAPRYVMPEEESWVLAAMEANIPIVVPGWEDSTLGNNFTAALLTGQLESPATCRSGVEYMMELAGWYAREAEHRPMGFFQIGGGIAGDFPICVVPMLHEELDRDDLPKFRYFAQVTDATESYGGYSGAPPSEKITWSKLDTDSEWYDIHSDATIVAPLIFDYVIGQ